jgi:hypothetical protein
LKTSSKIENRKETRNTEENGKHRGKWEILRKRENIGQNGKTPTIMA